MNLMEVAMKRRYVICMPCATEAHEDCRPVEYGRYDGIERLCACDVEACRQCRRIASDGTNATQPARRTLAFTGIGRWPNVCKKGEA